MALISSFIAAADRPGRSVRAAAGYLHRLATAQPKSEDGRRRDSGEVLVPARTASFVKGRPAGLGPVTVAYEQQGTGEPLVLLHGVGHRRQAWDAIVPLLTGQRETITMDLPGFGESPDLDPAVPRDLDTAVVWLGAVLAELGVERPHVVGHSLGGLIALHLGQAELARSVTALAPAGFWTDVERRYTYTMLAAARYSVRLLPDTAMVRLAHTAAARTAMAATLYGRPDRCPPETLIADLRALRDATAFGATLRAGREPGLFTGDIPDVPVTIVWGTCDRILPPWQAARVQAMIPGARLVQLPDCGHVPMNDAPDLLARVILEATPSAPRGQ
ncbi:alpha/beta fold hydrolase [Streptomyces sp. NBC_01549]|uniref:alpha/beta fold hydrolase n=1 Tax=Streptomyces sp. NBC_01549 TaxID=2975874 RepID=UPI00224F5DB6|nr:alpha/beta fold hydrolase [Streptomyces sp. NBC_01549]MCX4595867.1 alpha/beta fold hydrolase [Streptomyces sp. NBC_01549]